VGAERPNRVDVLVIAATNRALETMVEQGTFRRDLLTRLAAARLELPALRDRAEDIFAISQALLAERGLHLATERVDVEAVEQLMLHPWPGNVRELASALDRIAALAQGPALPLWAVERVVGRARSSRPGQLTPESVATVLAACAGNESRAARELGVSRGKLRRFLAARR
jgi:transcriptional regulator of acetoin/glycerol metabolism